MKGLPPEPRPRVPTAPSARPPAAVCAAQSSADQSQHGSMRRCPESDCRVQLVRSESPELHGEPLSGSERPCVGAHPACSESARVQLQPPADTAFRFSLNAARAGVSSSFHHNTTAPQRPTCCCSVSGTLLRSFGGLQLHSSGWLSDFPGTARRCPLAALSLRRSPPPHCPPPLPPPSPAVNRRPVTSHQPAAARHWSPGRPAGDVAALGTETRGGCDWSEGQVGRPAENAYEAGPLREAARGCALARDTTASQVGISTKQQ